MKRNYIAAIFILTIMTMVNPGNLSADCIPVENDLKLNICVEYQGAKYQTPLIFSPHDTGLYWKIDAAAFRQIQSGDDCIRVEDNLALKFSCVNYQGAAYAFVLNHSAYPNDSSDLYWKMDNTTFYRLPNYEATIADIRAEIARNLAAKGGPSAVSLALVDDQRIIWAEAFGSIDKSRNLAPTTETLLGLASGSKLFATIATMILVDRGIVDLDAPFVRYVPAFRMADGQAYDRITVRMLINHSSGLPGSEYRNGSTFFPVLGHAAQVMKTISTQRLKHAPGEMAVYCNDGFSMIEFLVAAMTGTSYADFISKEVFLPLGMAHSRFGTETLAPGSYATSLKANGEPNPQEYINVLATGGIYTTPGDMGRLAMMLLNGGQLGGTRVLSSSAVAEMGRNQSAALPLNPLNINDFGLGWDGVRQPGLAAVGVTAWHKNGGSNYFATQFDIAPNEHLAVMIMTAGGSLDVGTLAERIMLRALVERGSIGRMPDPMVPNPPPTTPTSEAELLAVTGGYASGNVYRLGRNDQSLTYSFFANGQWSAILAGLKRREGGDWIADSAPDQALFLVEADGRRHLAYRAPSGLKHYESNQILGQALTPLAALSAKWQMRLDKSWLMVNDPYGTFLAQGMSSPLFKLFQDPGLPGYLIADNKVVDPSISDARALMCTKVAARDINDLIVEERSGEEWLLKGSTLYRPLETVPVLGAGQTAIPIGAEGLGEWRKLPAASALTVAGAGAWYLYDDQFALLACVIQGMTIRAMPDKVPEGAYLVVHGAPNMAITVTVTASQL